MVKISEAGNTENPAFLVIRAKGYKLSVFHYEIQSENDIPRVDFIAEKDEHRFVATSGPFLLGLISIWENRGEDWQTRENEDFLY